MMTLGPFAVAPDGTLSPRAPGLSPAIRFAWRGRACEALMQEEGLRLRAIAGRIPSTAEPGADRHFTARAVADMPAGMPHGWRVRLTADHRVAFEVQAPPRSTAVGVLGEMVRFALALDPYLDRLEGVGA
jgi:hypothetical protein